MANKSCIVTGGSGFIGSNLVDVLLEKGYSVIAVDNLLTGLEGNLAKAKKNPLFSFVRADVIKSLPAFNHVDFIYHLASPASVVDYMKYPEETALVNSVGTNNMLEMALRMKARFLFASTSEIYGNPKEHPQSESYWGNVNPNGLRSCYDESKRYGEMLSMLYFRKHAVDIRIVRIFNTYGPRLKKDDGRVISNFINQALANEPITIYGNGSQTRSPCFVSDMVEGLILAMEKDNTSGQVINLGNPEEWTMIDLANKIKSMTDSTSKLVYLDLPVDDPTRRRPDITKAKGLLGWEPKVPVGEGLKKTIEHYKSNE